MILRRLRCSLSGPGPTGLVRRRSRLQQGCQRVRLLWTTKADFLVLTDHSSHSPENSLYGLVTALRADERTGRIVACSRGNPANDRFFRDKLLESSIHGVDIANTGRWDFDPTGRQFLHGLTTTELGRHSVVWLRLPPEEDTTFLTALADYADQHHHPPLWINSPRGILETGSKDFLRHFSDFTPPLRHCRSVEELREFASLYPATVWKPLRAYGGKGIVRILSGNPPMAEVDGTQMPLETWLDEARPAIQGGHYLGMPFLKNVHRGDKRILVVNGKILGASLRLPAPGDWLCNVSRGGRAVPAEVAPEEEAMMAAVAPVLLERGIVIFGADTLVDDSGKRVLSELNTNSIGGFPTVQAQTGRPILQQTIDGIYDYVKSHLDRGASLK